MYRILIEKNSSLTKETAGASLAVLRFHRYQPLILMEPVYHASDRNYLTKALPTPCTFVNLYKNSPKYRNITNPQIV